MRYTQVPNQCGTWPAFWTHAVGNVWPRGGEIDVLEYPNDSKGKSSFHTGDSRTCRTRTSSSSSGSKGSGGGSGGSSRGASDTNTTTCRTHAGWTQPWSTSATPSPTSTP
eukprot:scaffold10280_cov64-Phaeocystis_antarctica.AAC.7